MSRDELFEFGEFRLDVRERRLSRGATTIPLAPKTFDLLVALVRRAGRLTTKHELLALVWSDSFVEEGILAVHVSSLRKALPDTDGGRRYIETVSGSGYRFIAPVTAIELDDVPTSAVTTLAVLPFKSLVGEAPEPSLEIGIADSLIARLGRFSTVVVRPLGLVRKYTALDQDPVTAGGELRVPLVLDGTIHRYEARVRITARLVTVGDGHCRWGATFDEPFNRIFDLENAIVEQIANVLRLEVAPEHRQSPARPPTRSSDAYVLYLRGRYLWERWTEENARKAIRCFEAAIERDTDYALAWSGLAGCYVTLPLTSGAQPREAFPKARAAALKALALDESLSDAHRALAGVKFWHDWEWPNAEHEFRRAIDWNPNEPSTHRFFGHFLSNMGRHAEALEEVRKSLEIEPLSILTNTRLGQFLYHAGEFDHALEQLQDTIELDPNFWMTHLILGLVLQATGRHGESIRALRRACTLASASGQAQAALGYALAASGETSNARSVLAALADLQTRGLSHAYHLALVCAGLGDHAGVHAWLDQALVDRDVGLTFMAVEPRWRLYDDDPVVRQVIADVGLPERRHDA
jgi:DNA-binding winged helix-turn-helix (wHTH) protein/tetratricopeptide (TPR) repeat protein